MGPEVTIGVPVYRGERFLAAALRSIQAQTHTDLQVILSVDGPDPASEAVARSFLGDPRFRLVVQPERKGWVGNLNWLMDQVETPYWYYHQQDDLVDPRYVEILVNHAEQTPEAAVVFCDMRAFGLRDEGFSQPSVTGSASGRLLALLYDHHPAVAFRGLTRVKALRLGGGLRSNAKEGFSADTTWMAGVARWGELRRVPGEFYRKRYHEDNVHTKWQSWPLEERRRAWTLHCVDMLGHAMLVDAQVQERRLLWAATVARLISPRTAGGYVQADELRALERAAMLEGLFEEVRTTHPLDVPGWLDADWEEIEAWTRGFYWLPRFARPRSLLRRLRGLLLSRIVGADS